MREDPPEIGDRLRRGQGAESEIAEVLGAGSTSGEWYVRAGDGRLYVVRRGSDPRWPWQRVHEHPVGDDRLFRNKAKAQLLAELWSSGSPGEQKFERMRTAIAVRAVEDIEQSFGRLAEAIEHASQSGEDLQEKL